MSDRSHYFLNLSVFLVSIVILQEVKTSSFFKFNSTLLHINIQNKGKKNHEKSKGNCKNYSIRRLLLQKLSLRLYIKGTKQR